MSATHGWFGAVAVKSRSTRSGAGLAWSRRVAVTPARRRLAPTGPAARIRRAIRLRPCFSPLARGSACTRGGPWVSREPAWMVRSRSISAASAWAWADGRRCRHAWQPASDTPSTRAMAATGKEAWFAPMNRKSRTARPRPPLQTRPRLEKGCRAPPAAACSRAGGVPTRRARPCSGPCPSPPGGLIGGQPGRPRHRSTAPSARTRGQDHQRIVWRGPGRPSDGGTQANTVGVSWA